MLLAWAGPALLSNLVKQKVLTALRRELGGDVSLAELRISVWNAGVQLRDLKIIGGRYDNLSVESLHLPSLTWHAGWSILWGDVKTVDQLRIPGIVAHIRYLDGTPGATPGAGAPQPSSRARGRAPFLLRQMDASGSLRLQYRLHGRDMDRTSLRRLDASNASRAPPPEGNCSSGPRTTPAARCAWTCAMRTAGRAWPGRYRPVRHRPLTPYWRGVLKSDI